MTNKTDKNSQTTSSGAQSQIEQLSTDTNPQADSRLPEPVIFTYTRAEALADGVQVDVSKAATEAGIKVPVFVTAGVFWDYVDVPEGVTGQDEKGRLWDILWMLHLAIRRAAAGVSRITFELFVRNSDEKPAELVTLVAELSPMDFDDPTPAITVMLPDED